MPKQIPIAAVGHTRRSLARQQLVAVAAPSNKKTMGQHVLLKATMEAAWQMKARLADEGIVRWLPGR